MNATNIQHRLGNAEHIDTVDRPPAGWFVLDVLRADARKWDWIALVIDTDPDEMKNCVCPPPLFLYVHPKEYRPGSHTVRQCRVRVPGKHRNADAAWDALQDMLEARR